MQFQVPQFIESEDKVVGPLTIRQFIYIGIAGGVCAVFYFMLATWLWMMVSVVIMGCSAALAFTKVNGRPLIDVALSAAGFYWKPQIYLWQSEQREMKKEDHPGIGAAIENIAAGMALHKSWESLQTGPKISNTQMTDHYQIFRKIAGDRNAAKRVDYR